LFLFNAETRLLFDEEPLEVLDNTFYHVNRIAWRGTKTVWVLDDGASDALRDLAHRYGNTKKREKKSKRKNEKKKKTREIMKG